jgi:phage regulator Rha-like protein
MQDISTITQQTMSSLEIAKLTEKNHSDVLRDIRKILNEAGIGESKYAFTYLSEQNKELPCFHLPRRECDLIVSGYSVKYRLAIIDRWHELEANKKPMNILEMIAFQALELNEANKRIEDHEVRLKEMEADRSALSAMLDMNLQNKLENSEDHQWGKGMAVTHILGKINK